MAAKKKENDTVSIKIQWERCKADSEQYKPNGNEFLLDHVLIEVSVPAKYVSFQGAVGTEGNRHITTVLTEEGHAWLTAYLRVLSNKATGMYRTMTTTKSKE